MVRISNGPDHLKSEQNDGHFVQTFENQTPSIIQNPNAFGNRAPTVWKVFVEIEKSAVLGLLK